MSEGKAEAPPSADVELRELLDQVADNVTIRVLLNGWRCLTPRVVTGALLDIRKARECNGLPPYPPRIVQSAAWSFMPPRTR